MACALLGMNSDSLWADRALFGRLLETFVYEELRRHASWWEEAVAFSHFRDKDQVEVDVVLEFSGRVAGGDRPEAIGEGPEAIGYRQEAI